MRLTALKVEGFRSLVGVELPLRALNVMIGPNGSGKTSILEILQLLKDATQEGLALGLEKLGGLNAVLSRVPDGADRLTVELVVDVESQKSAEPMYYHVVLVPRDPGYAILEEGLQWHFDLRRPTPLYYVQAKLDDIRYFDPATQALARPTWDYHYGELALAQAPRVYAEPQALRKMLAATRSFSFLDVGRRAVVRLPQGLTPTTSPGPNGENLYSALYNLRALNPSDYERILDVLHLAFTEFAQLEFPVVGAGQVTLAWHQRDLTRPLYPSELSEGTLRFLWLATLLLSPQTSPITLIDEPEVSLHPELLKLLAGLLQDASARTQLIVATHSSDLVRWLEPDEVAVLDKEEGRTRLTWADSLDLAEWLKEYTLADLWLMGTLGGRP